MSSFCIDLEPILLQSKQFNPVQCAAFSVQCNALLSFLMCLLLFAHIFAHIAGCIVFAHIEGYIIFAYIADQLYAVQSITVQLGV